MFRITVLFITALLISFRVNSQTWRVKSLDNKKIDRPANVYLPEQKYTCELSRIGKLIVKPLVRDSVIHYEYANSDSSPTVTVIPDVKGLTSVVRYVRIRDRILNLSFLHKPRTNTCEYRLSIDFKNSEPTVSFCIDGSGNILSCNSNIQLTNEEIISKQREVNAWLTYFE
jgi:hypothetical protein